MRFPQPVGTAARTDFGTPTQVGAKRGRWMLDTIWVETRRLLRDALAAKDYEAWIEPLRAARWVPGELTLEVPSAFSRDWLRRHFVGHVERAVTTASGQPANITLVVNRGLDVPANGRPASERRPGPPPVAPNARYTFDNFVVGASNHVAYGAARAVVAQP